MSPGWIFLFLISAVVIFVIGNYLGYNSGFEDGLMSEDSEEFKCTDPTCKCHEED